MKFDKKFWIGTGVSLAITLLGLFIYDNVRARMASDA